VNLQKISTRNKNTLTTKIKNQKNKNYKKNFPVDVIHGIKEDSGGVSRVHNNAAYGDIQIFVHKIVLLNVDQSSRQLMFSILHIEHLPNKVSGVGIILKHGIKLIIGLLS